MRPGTVLPAGSQALSFSMSVLLPASLLMPLGPLELRVPVLEFLQVLRSSGHVLPHVQVYFGSLSLHIGSTRATLRTSHEPLYF